MTKSKAVKTKACPAPSAPKWSEIEQTRKSLVRMRGGDQFFKLVLDGALQAARQKANPIRGNLAAAALRELVGHLLHSLAPDAELTACSWYSQVRGTNGPTRAQRAQFIAHGALSPQYVEETLGLVIDDIATPLLDAMGELNKRTHVRSGSVLNASEEVRWLCGEVLDAVVDLLEAARDCRSAVEEQLREHIDEAVMDRLIEEQIQELDELSTHTTVDEHQSEEIEVVEIGLEVITLSVTGTVYITLQYGSNSDVRNDIGAVMSDSYPYRAVVQVKTLDPTVFVGTIDVQVDTREFYE